MQLYEEDDNDPVVSEMDVYLCNNPEEVFLLQYPTRLPWRPFDLSSVNEVRYKPAQQGLELDVKLNSDFSDEDSSYQITHHTYKGSVTSIRANYAVGFIKSVGGQAELILLPIDAVSQLRPELNYITGPTEVEEQKSVEDTGKKRIAVSAAPTKKQKDLEQLRKDEAEEAINMTLADITNAATIEVVENMSQNSRGEVAWDNNPENYINKVAPALEKDVCKQPTRDKIVELLKIGKILTLDRVVELLNSTKEMVVGWIAEICWFVKGALVLRDGFLIECGARELAVRDVILSSIEEKGMVDLDELQRLWPEYHTQMKMVKRVLESYSRLSDGIWQPKVTDKDLESSWAQLSKSSRVHWKSVKQSVEQKMKELDAYGDEFSYGSTEKSVNTSSLIKERSSSPLAKFLTQCLHKYGACTATFLKKLLLEEKKNSQSVLNEITISQEILLASLDPIAHLIDGVYIAKEPPEDADPEIRTIVIDLVLQKKSVTPDELRQRIISLLSRKPSVNEIKRHASEFMTMRGRVWFLKKGDGTD
ncbi:DNA-directed RNA polymerase III subunit RPC5 [Entamoeba marina]